MLLFWSALIVDGRVVRLGRWERWEIGVVGKEWWVGRSEVPDFIQGWGMQSVSKIFDVNQGTKRQNEIAIGIACTFFEDCRWEVQMQNKNGVTIKGRNSL